MPKCSKNTNLSFKALVVFLTTVALFAAFAQTPAEARRHSQKDREASIVIEAQSGKILSAKDVDKQLYPASLTKMMTLYLTFDALDKGELSLSTYLPVSQRAARQEPSSLGLKRGDRIKVRDAILAIVTKSANDVAVTLAEGIGGDEESFARMMTVKARSLGMKNTTFKNASGLFNPYQVSTARDMAILARALIYKHNNYYRYFNTASFTYKGNTYLNHNKLMSSYKGMDGLKTGYIYLSGFNLVASAVRDGTRLIGVVFGGKTSKSRNNQMAKALDNGFHYIAGKKDIAPQPSRTPNVTIASAVSTPTRPVVARLEEKAVSVVPVRRPLDDEGMGYDESVSTIAESAIAHINNYSVEMEQGDASPDFEENVKLSNNWAIQLGSFRNRHTTVSAFKAAKHKVSVLNGASEMVVPLATKRGTVYRARLVGLKLNEAKNACSVLGGSCLVLTDN